MITRVVALFIAMSSPAAAETAAPELYRSVRTLQRLQDAMVHGDADAQKVRVKLLAEIAGRHATGERNERNARAAIVYLLSGGKAEIGAAYIAASEVQEELKHLVEGAMAYAEDDKAKAAGWLLPAGLGKLPADVAGQIALVRASLRKDGEHDLMRADLALAAALMPGTLIEESALRRAAALAAETRDLDSFERASGRYFRRFANSIYAGQFAEAFAGFVETLDYNASPERFAALDAMTGGLTREQASYIHLEIARHALLRGERALATFAAERVRGSAATDSVEAARAALYAGAVLVATDAERYTEGKAMLESVDRAELTAEDIELLDRALTLATRVAMPPTVAEVTETRRDGREPGAADPLEGLLREASAALANADMALKDGRH